MSGAYAAAPAKANPGTDQCVGHFRQDGRLNSLLMRVAHTLWPTKTASEIASRTGVSVRTAERWIGGQRYMSALHFVRLLRCEEGIHFLVAGMTDAVPAPLWLNNVRRAHSLGSLRRQKAKLDEAIHEFESLGDDIARAEAALRFRDEDFHRPDIDALRALGRVPRRPVDR